MSSSVTVTDSTWARRATSQAIVPMRVAPERVGGHTADGYVYGLSGSEGGVEGGAVLGLDPDDANCSLHGSGHSGHQPAAADGDQDHIKRLGDLLDKLQADRSLAGAHLWLVVGVANERPCPFGIDQHGLVGVVVPVANLHYFGAQRPQLVHLERRGVGRYEDPGCGPGLAAAYAKARPAFPPRQPPRQPDRSGPARLRPARG